MKPIVIEHLEAELKLLIMLNMSLPLDSIGLRAPGVLEKAKVAGRVA
jgi:hypothetical protein